MTNGVIGALVSALQASGIVVSIAGPGKQVAVVERMARTMKDHYICHELALPFVMTHTLIVWCVNVLHALGELAFQRLLHRQSQPLRAVLRAQARRKA